MRACVGKGFSGSGVTGKVGQRMGAGAERPEAPRAVRAVVGEPAGAGESAPRSLPAGTEPAELRAQRAASPTDPVPGRPKPPNSQLEV